MFTTEYPIHEKEVEQAKGILRTAYDLTEPEAYRALVLLAQNNSIKKEEASSLICSAAKRNTITAQFKTELDKCAVKARIDLLRKELEISKSKCLEQHLRDVTKELKILKEAVENFVQIAEECQLDKRLTSVLLEAFKELLQ